MEEVLRQGLRSRDTMKGKSLKDGVRYNVSNRDLTQDETLRQKIKIKNEHEERIDRYNV